MLPLLPLLLFVPVKVCVRVSRMTHIFRHCCFRCGISALSLISYLAPSTKTLITIRQGHSPRLHGTSIPE